MARSIIVGVTMLWLGFLCLSRRKWAVLGHWANLGGISSTPVSLQFGNRGGQAVGFGFSIKEVQRGADGRGIVDLPDYYAMVIP